MSDFENTDFNSKKESVKLCALCALPLGDFELSLSHKWHRECQKCYVCKEEVSHDIALSFVHGRINYIGHKPCHESHCAEKIAKRPITITQGLLDFLNEKALMCSPTLSRSVEDNMSLAENAGNKVYHHMSSLEEKYIALKMMQGVCAAWSVLLSNDKKLLDIKIKREEQYEKKTKELTDAVQSAEGFRESEQRQKEIKREKKSPDWKAIQGLVATGAFTEDSAREFLKKQKENVASNISNRPPNTVN